MARENEGKRRAHILKGNLLQLRHGHWSRLVLERCGRLIIPRVALCLGWSHHHVHNVARCKA